MKKSTWNILMLLLIGLQIFISIDAFSKCGFIVLPLIIVCLVFLVHMLIIKNKYY